MDQHSGISRQRIAGLPPLLELHLSLRISARTAPAVHANLVVALNFDIMAGFSQKEAIALGASRPSGLSLQQGTFRAFSPFSQFIFLRTVMHPMYVDLDGARQLLLANPLPGTGRILLMRANTGSGKPISLVIPLPVAIGETDIPGLISREVGLDPPHFC